MAELAALLNHLISHGGSDLHLKAGASPYIRVNGRLQPTPLPKMQAVETQALADELTPPDRAEELRTQGETDFAIGVPGVGRFRASILRQRGSIGIVLRRVLAAPPSFEALGLPASVQQLAESRAGLILVTGPADSGKSTTVASMLDHINTQWPASVVSIEDPIEILHTDKQGFINQREVGTDTKTHATGIRRALRHDPDVIYVDRISDGEVMSQVLAAARGRLVISTLPALDSEETIARVDDFYPESHRRQARQELSSVLEGIVAQRLLDRMDGKGRVAAFEIMIMTPRIHDSIVEAPGSQTLTSLISAGDYYGMQTMDQHLLELHRNRVIGTRTAIDAAIKPQDLRTQLE